MKAVWLLTCIYLLTGQLHAQPADSNAPRVGLNGSLKNQLTAGEISYLLDPTMKAGFSRIQLTPFTCSYDSFVHVLNRAPTQNLFWLKFELANHSDLSLGVGSRADVGLSAHIHLEALAQADGSLGRFGLSQASIRAN